MLLAGLENENRVVELRRIVVTRRREGIGRRALALVLARVSMLEPEWRERAES